MEQAKVERINELARLSKVRPLTDAEKERLAQAPAQTMTIDLHVTSVQFYGA